MIWDSVTKFFHKDVYVRAPNPHIQPLINPWIEEQNRLNATYYRLTNNTDYQYEFRYEFNTNTKDGEHRLIIFIGGRGRTCIDYWRFPVGRRIVTPMRDAGFSLLAICSTKRNYDVNDFVWTNEDVKWIYKSLQQWMNNVYYEQFQRYPLIYLHGVSRGTVFAPLIARILPVQALLLTVNPGHHKALTTPSIFSKNMQRRLSLDSTFANWFYFDYCYKAKPNMTKDMTRCPFHTNLNYFFPVPPMYFVVLQDDPWIPLKRYRNLIRDARNNSIQLGGKLLEHQDSIHMDILPPKEITPSYMHEHFDLWKNKPYASQIFSEYYNNWTIPMLNISQNGTCRCTKANFVFLENYPEITAAWPEEKQAQHIDYVLDIKEYQNMFCEDICGDIRAYHGMVSRNVPRMIEWVFKIDRIRKSLRIADYAARPLQIWMYEKESLIHDIANFSNYDMKWASVGIQYRMYVSEYLIQDYFQRYPQFRNQTKRPMVYTRDPLIADFFIVPHDTIYFYFDAKPETMYQARFEAIRKSLSDDYFGKILDNVMNRFPYWTMAKTAGLMGANHIFAFPGGRAMGYLDDNNQMRIRNVIQLVYTGLRQDLLPPGSPIPYSHYMTLVNYRHTYDIVMPQFTDIRANKTLKPLWNVSYHRKNRLFYFAGALSHVYGKEAARQRISVLWSNMTDAEKYNKTIKIDGRSFHPLLIVNGHVSPDQYADSMLSAVFSLCPEGFLPWSPRLYEAIQLGAVPLILADNVVLPFERFIDWKSFSAKINITNIQHMISLVQQIPHFKAYIKQKLINATSHMKSFRWPYRTMTVKNISRHEFIPTDDLEGNAKNVFHYLALEIRCRGLEQLYGLTSDTLSPESMKAKDQACKQYPTICPCHDQHHHLAFHQYF